MTARDGYCEHGRYVGGCGIDWICGPCEDGISQADIEAGRRADAHAQALTYDAAWDIARDSDDPDFSAASREAVRDVIRGIVV